MLPLAIDTIYLRRLDREKGEYNLNSYDVRLMVMNLWQMLLFDQLEG